MEREIVGQTKTVGFQVGVRRTFPITQEKAWELITSENGLKRWLKAEKEIIFQPGQKYRSENSEGEIRIVKPFEQLRLTWRRADWQKPSTVQVRAIPKEANKTTISFHQENLTDENAREEMKKYWETIQEEIKQMIG